MCPDCRRLRSLERGTFRTGLFGQHLDFRGILHKRSLVTSITVRGADLP